MIELSSRRGKDRRQKPIKNFGVHFCSICNTSLDFGYTTPVKDQTTQRQLITATCPKGCGTYTIESKFINWPIKKETIKDEKA